VTITEPVRKMLLAGSATIAATRDESLRPALTRGWGLLVGDEGESLTLCLGTPPGSAVRANLEANGEIAVTCSQPTTYRTVQVKGKAEVLGPPDEQQSKAVADHLAAFSAEVAGLGLGGDPALLLDDELLAVVVSPREVFDQTPGPGAGRRL
jgi:hypothetical protein